MRTLRLAAALLASLAALACAGGRPAPVPAPSPAPTGAASVVTDFTAAFNRHDVPAMLALADTAIEWLSVEGSRVAPETVGRAALEGAMTRYFARLPSARSVAESVLENGPFVVVRERAEWTARDGRPRAQRAIAVYEVREGKVRRVWYYPVVR